MANVFENIKGTGSPLKGIVETIKDMKGEGTEIVPATFMAIDANGEKKEVSNASAGPIYKTPTGYSGTRSYAALVPGENGKLTFKYSSDLLNSDAFKANYLENDGFKQVLKAYNANSNASTVIPVTDKDGKTENMTFSQLVEKYNTALQEFANGYEGYSIIRDNVKNGTGFTLTDDEIRIIGNTIDADDKKSDTKVIMLPDEWTHIYDFSSLDSWDEKTRSVSAKDFFEVYNLDKKNGINEEAWNEMMGSSNGVVANAYSGNMKKNVDEDAGGDAEAEARARERLARSIAGAQLLAKYDPEQSFWHTASITASNTVLTVGNNLSQLLNKTAVFATMSATGYHYLGDMAVAWVQDAVTSTGILQGAASQDLESGEINAGNYREYIDGILVSATDGSQSEIDRVKAEWRAKIAASDTIPQYLAESDENPFNQLDEAVKWHQSYTAQIAPAATRVGVFMGEMIYLAIEVWIANKIGGAVGGWVPEGAAGEALTTAFSKGTSISSRLAALGTLAKATGGFAVNMSTQALIDSIAFEDANTFIDAWMKLDPGAQEQLAWAFADNFAGNVFAEAIGVGSQAIGGKIAASDNKAAKFVHSRAVKAVNTISLPKKKFQKWFAKTKLAAILNSPLGKGGKAAKQLTDMVIKQANESSNAVFKAQTLEEWNIEKAELEYAATKGIATAKKGIKYMEDLEKGTMKIAESTTEAILGKASEKANFLNQASRVAEGVKAYKGELLKDASIESTRKAAISSANDLQKVMKWSDYNPAAHRYMNQEASNYVVNKNHYDDLIRKQSQLALNGQTLNAAHAEKLTQLEAWLNNFRATHSAEVISALDNVIAKEQEFYKALTDWQVRHGTMSAAQYKSIADTGFFGAEDQYYIRAIALPEGRSMYDFEDIKGELFAKSDAEFLENNRYATGVRDIQTVFDQDLHLSNKVGSNYIDPLQVNDMTIDSVAKAYQGKMWYNSLTSIKAPVREWSMEGKPVTNKQVDATIKNAENAAAGAINKLSVKDLIGTDNDTNLGKAFRETRVEYETETIDKNGKIKKVHRNTVEEAQTAVNSRLGIKNDDQVATRTNYLHKDQVDDVISTFGSDAPNYGKVRSNEELKAQFESLSPKQQEQALKAMGEKKVTLTKTQKVQVENPEYASWKKEKAAFEKGQDEAEKAFNKEQKAAKKQFNDEQNAAERAFNKEQKNAKKEYDEKVAAANKEIKEKEKYEKERVKAEEEFKNLQEKKRKKFERDQANDLKALTDRHAKEDRALEREARDFEKRQAKNKQFFEKRQKIKAEKHEKEIQMWPEKKRDKLMTEFKNKQENDLAAFDAKQKKEKESFYKEHEKEVKEDKKIHASELKDKKELLNIEKRNFISEQKEDLKAYLERSAKNKKEFEAGLSGVKPEDITLEEKTFERKEFEGKTFERKEFDKPAPEEFVMEKKVTSEKSTVTALDQPGAMRAWNQAVDQTDMVNDLNKTYIQERIAPKEGGPAKMSETTRKTLESHIAQNSLDSMDTSKIKLTDENGNGRPYEKLKKEYAAANKRAESYKAAVKRLEDAKEMARKVAEGTDQFSKTLEDIADNSIAEGVKRLENNSVAEALRAKGKEFGLDDDTLFRHYALSGMVEVDGAGNVVLSSKYKNAFKKKFSDHFAHAPRSEGNLTEGMEKALFKEASEKLEEYVTKQWRDSVSAINSVGASELTDTTKVFDAIEGDMKKIVGDIKGNRNIVQVLDPEGNYKFVEVDPLVADLYRSRSYVQHGNDSLMRKLSKFARLSNTTFNPKSWFNQTFKDPFQSVVMAGWAHSIKTYQREIADMFGDDIVRYLQESMGEAGWTKFAEGMSNAEAKLAATKLMTEGEFGAGVFSGELTQNKLFATKTVGEDFVSQSQAAATEGYANLNGGYSKKKGMADYKKTKQGFLDWAADHTPGGWINNKREIYFRKANYTAAFNDALKRGQTIGQARATAELVSRNATTNFSNTFMWGNWICNNVPFLSAAINGSASFWRLFEMDPIGIMTRLNGAGLAVMAQVISSGQTLEDRNTLDTLPDYVKNSNMVFIENGQVVKIPLPEEVAIFLAPFRQAAEKMLHTENRSWVELLYNDALNISPIDLDGFSTEDQTALTKNEGLLSRIGRQAQIMISQCTPPFVQTAFMVATGEDPYTGNPIDNSYTWYDDEGNKQTYTYAQSEFAKWFANVANKHGWNVSADMAEAVMEKMFGTGFELFLDDFTSLGQAMIGKDIEGNDISEEDRWGKVFSGIERAGTEAAKTLTVNEGQLRDQYDKDFKNIIKQLQKEKTELLNNNGDYVSAITELSKLKTTDKNYEERKQNLTRQALQQVEDFRQKALDTVTTYVNHYGSDYDDKKFCSVVALLNFYTPSTIPTTALDFQREKEAYYDGRSDAYQTMIDMGFSSPGAFSILGVAKRNEETGEVYTKFYSPVAILNAGDAVWNNMAKAVNAEIAAAIDVAGIDRQQMFGDEYKAAKAQGGKVLKQYKKDWNAKVVKAIAPTINQYGAETVLENGKVQDFLDDYIFVTNPYKTKEYLEEIFEVEAK